MCEQCIHCSQQQNLSSKVNKCGQKKKKSRKRGRGMQTVTVCEKYGPCVIMVHEMKTEMRLHLGL